MTQEFDLCRAQKDHSVFRRIQKRKRILLTVYVDDIIITKDDTKEIVRLKKYLHEHFQTKDLGSLNYFIDIEVAMSKKGIFLHREYIFDLLLEAGML